MITGDNITCNVENWNGTCLEIDQQCQAGAKCDMTVVAKAAAKTLQKATTEQKKTLTQIGLNISTDVQKQVQNIKQFFENKCVSTAQAQNIIKNAKLNVTCKNGSGTCLRLIQFGNAKAACAVLTTLQTISKMSAEAVTTQTGSNALMWVLFGLGAVVIVGGIIYYAAENRRRRRAGEQVLSARQMLWSRQRQQQQQQPKAPTPMAQPVVASPARASAPIPMVQPVVASSPAKTKVTVESTPAKTAAASLYSAFYNAQGW